MLYYEIFFVSCNELLWVSGGPGVGIVNDVSWPTFSSLLFTWRRPFCEDLETSVVGADSNRVLGLIGRRCWCSKGATCHIETEAESICRLFWFPLGCPNEFRTKNSRQATVNFIWMHFSKSSGFVDATSSPASLPRRGDIGTERIESWSTLDSQSISSVRKHICFSTLILGQL